MKDLHSGFKAVVAIAAASLTADPTPPAIDRRGYEAVELLLSVGVGGITLDGTNKVEFKLTHSDDNVTYDAVEQKDVLGTTVAAGGIVKSLVAAHAAAAAYRFGYKGNRRYLKLLPDFSGTHGTGTPISAIALLGYGHDNPQSNQI